MKEEVTLKSKMLEERNKELETKHQNSLDLQVSTVLRIKLIATLLWDSLLRPF